MKKYVIPTIIILVILSFSFSLIKNFSKPTSKNKFSDCVPNIVIVKYKSDASNSLSKNQVLKNSFEALLSKYNIYKSERIYPSHQNLIKGTASVTIDLARFYLFSYSADVDPNIVAKDLALNPIVEYAEPKIIRHLCFTPNDSYFNQQYALKKIMAEQAWGISQGDTNVVIGIVDTGIDWLHQDLSANIWRNKREIANNGIDDDGNGYIDDIRGWDLGGLGNGNQPTPDNDPNEDNADHGTHVAGIASAATNNNLGVAGIGFKCKLMPVKVTQNNRRSSGPPDVLYGYEGIVYAADNGANVINCSWGGGGFSRYENDIIQYANQKGALIVAASGNSGSTENSFYPAAYEHVLAVTSTDQYDQRSYFSNTGPYVDVSAPGSSILNTWYQPKHEGPDGIYQLKDGTSMASPLVAGLAALVKSKFPAFTPDQVGEQVRISCDNIDSINYLFKQQMGYGRINAYKALTISSPSVRMTKMYINDTIYGNGNGTIEPGEKILLKINFVNYLNNTNNLSVNLKSTNDYVKINSASFSPGKINTLQSFNNYSNMFEIVVDSVVPYNYQSLFTLSYSDQNYNDFQSFSLTLNPSFENAQINNINMTITSAGNLAFNDYPDNTQGTGFRYKSSFDNILFEGALMIATSAGKLSDVARGVDQNNKDNHFKIVKALRFSRGVYSDEESSAIFNDDLNPQKINVSVTMNSFAYKSEPYNNFIILNYRFQNNNLSDLSSFYAGLFFDWDLGPSGSDNMAIFDAKNNLGYVYNIKGIPGTYTGVSLLNNTDKLNYFPILNDDTSSAYFQIYDGFSSGEKFRALMSKTIRQSAGPGDISMVIGAGPLSIPAGGTINVTFVILAGENLLELQNSLQYAKEKFNGITLSTRGINSSPVSYNLYQNYPNPFNPTTTVRFAIKESGYAKIQIYDIKGSMIKEIIKNGPSAGEYSENIDFSGFSSGIYFYKIFLFGKNGMEYFSQSKKMILLK